MSYAGFLSLASVAALVAQCCSPAWAAPSPKALSPVDEIDSSLQSVATTFYVRLRDDAAPDTAPTTINAKNHIELTVMRFVDAAQQSYYAVRSRANGDAYLAVDASGARTDVVQTSKMNKDEGRHVLFRKKDTTCGDTMAFESLMEPNNFLTEVCPEGATDSCSLRLAPLDANAGANSVCLDTADKGVPKNALFKQI